MCTSACHQTSLSAFSAFSWIPFVFLWPFSVVIGKVLAYSILSVGPRADPGIQAVSPQLTVSPPGGRLPLLSASPAFYLRKHSPDVASPIAVYYSSVDREGMKGWVGLVGWPIADGLPTSVVTRQLQVERRTEKVCWPETDVLLLSHAANRFLWMTLILLCAWCVDKQVHSWRGRAVKLCQAWCW